MQVVRYSKWAFLVLLACCVAVSSGCGTVRTVGEKVSPVKLAKKVMPRTAHLNKRVLLLDPVDQAGYGPEAAERVEKEMKSLFEGYSRFLIEKPPEGIAWKDLGLDLRIAAPVDLLDYCREEGISTIVTLILSPIESTPRNTGIWPFRSQSMAFAIPVRLTAIDVANGTILLTRSVTEEDVIKLYDAEMKTDRELLDRFVSRTVPRIVARQVGEVVDEMDRWHWQGTILSMENGKMIINAGTDLGVKKGSRFEVLNEAGEVTAKDGRVLTIPGSRIGELVVTAPGARTSVAEPAKDGDFEPGLIIRYKP